MRMENDEKNDSSTGRRSFFRKLVAVAAATGISGLLLGKLAEPVRASNIIPGSGQATFNGPVGIATTSPETLLHVSGSATTDVFCGLGPHPNHLVSGVFVGPAMNYGYSGHSFGRGSGFFNVRPDASATAPNPSLRFMTNNVQAMIISNTGYVGIGLPSSAAPAKVLHIQDPNTHPNLFLDAGSSGYTNIWMGRAGSAAWDLCSNFELPTDSLTFYDYTILAPVVQLNPGGLGSSTGSIVNIGNPIPTSNLIFGATCLQAESDAVGGNGLVAQVTDTTGTPYAMYGSAPANGYAFVGSGQGWFTGNLNKAGGGFLIDHPLDPANKLLFHSFVESPDMKNLYDGVATLDANGEAVVQLPTYFGAVNKDFRYQLTPIGGPMPNLYIASKVDNNNQFKISGGTLNAEVSWTVTGTRQDPWANANRPTVEQSKAEKQGTYIHPELYGQPESQSYLKTPTTGPAAPSTRPEKPS